MRFPKSKLVSKVLVAAIIFAALGVAVWQWRGTSRSELSDAGVWTCSMHPQVRLPQPGQCPICGMTLIPASSQGDASVQVGSGWETEPVSRRELLKEIQTVGKLDYNEARVELITARIAGRVDRLYADFTGIEVKQQDHLVDIYSPELYSAQAELIRALEAFESSRAGKSRLTDRFAETNLKAAREKLRLWGILPEQIEDIEKTGTTRTHLTIFAPLAGTVIEKSVRLGQYVKEGEPLYRIAELDPIWLYLDLYEYDIGLIRYGQPVEVALEAFPGETFRGMVTFIDPFLDESTRTVKVRVNLKNPDRRLKAGMYATATIRIHLLADGGPAPTGLEGKYSCPMHPEVVQEEPGKCDLCKMDLVRIPERGPFALPSHDEQPELNEDAGAPLSIRASAVLDTGRRQIAYRLAPDGNYELVELQVGPLSVGTDATGHSALYHPVLHGLSEGDEVVVRGGFLLDSQTQIEGRPSLLFPQGQSGAGLHGGHAGHGGQTGHGSPQPKPKDGEHKH